MTLPPVIRLFFAVEVSSTLKASLMALIDTLKKQTKGHGVRWTKPENLHITLQFMAEMPSTQLPMLIDAVRREISRKCSGMVLEFGQLYLYPNPYRPRVIVLEVTPQDPLAKLSTLIGQGILATHYPVERRPFRAHLTLGRIKQPQGIDTNVLLNTPFRIEDPMPVEEIVLFRSEPQPQGSRYSVLERLALE